MTRSQPPTANNSRGNQIGRRAVMRAGVGWSGVAFLGGTQALLERLIAQSRCDSSSPAGELVGLVSLHGDRARTTTFGKLIGGPGLDARLFTDLSKLRPDRLITPTDTVFVRTAAPSALKTTPVTTIRVRGVSSPGPPLILEALRRNAKPMGAHLIECSGNADPDNFGLMSVAEWTGVALSQVVAELRRTGWQRGELATALLVSGLDEPQQSRTSSPGASWVIPLNTLERLGAFLAVGMNGKSLTPDHGAPVRLVVPGWYGCSWIKWVNEVRFVGPKEPATAQMLEFSSRTHQPEVPGLASEYEPPVIDLAATPIRVEKRRLDGRIEYRVVGIVWGGDRPVDRLMIRFSAGEEPTPFDVCPAPTTHRIWSLWDYRWRPTSPGVYNIALKAADPTIRTRRLDLSYYVRRVIIDEV